MPTPYEKLSALLKECFQTDQADLDFGIYRVINHKRDEINYFLDEELLPQVKEAFDTYQPLDRKNLQTELEKASNAAEEAGFDPKDSPRVKQIQEQLASYSVNLVDLENEVYADLYQFFRRYYDKGDFISQRRYKKGVYAIPYEGEEVKLYWANHDQYYIKSSEYLRDYKFRLLSGKKVHFKLIEADTEKDNVKSTPENERAFFLADQPFEWIDDELAIRFEFILNEGKVSQDKLNEESLRKIFEHRTNAVENLKATLTELATPTPTENNHNRTLLEKHLGDYTRRNTSDYFIHKDLGGFLRRELDFYIKNEVMLLDDIDQVNPPRMEQHLSKIKVLRKIAHKIIDFLSQIEDFQKKLWLKKKLVVSTHYCVTLDRVPPELYPVIAANKRQYEEWVRLFAINQINNKPGELFQKSEQSQPMTVQFLYDNPFLIVDTQFFDENFKFKLLNSFDDLDNQLDGLLIHSDNFQALNLLQRKYNNKIECIYIDPPYNTDKDRNEGKFLYKDNFEHSTWLSLIQGNLSLSLDLLTQKGSFFASCDENEFISFGKVLNDNFGSKNHVETIIWNKRVPKNDKGIGNIHEYIFLFSKNQTERINQNLPYIMIKDGLEDIFDLVNKCKKNGVSIKDTQKLLKDYYRKQGFDRGITLYCNLDNDYEIFGKINLSWPNPQTQGPRYEVINPITNRPVPIPKKGWRWTENTFKLAEDDGETQELFDGNLLKGKIWFSTKYNTQPSSITYLKDVKTFLLRSIISLKSDGSLSLESYGLNELLDYPKPVELMKNLLFSVNTNNGYFLDYFAGSGTTGDALINLNREDGGQRKYILVEMGNYFNSVTKPRIEKVIYSKDWRDGKPVSREGSSHAFKYLKLESYEDSLNNLKFLRTPHQNASLQQDLAFREDYLLNYMLDLESKGSLLNLDVFSHPFNYWLNISNSYVGQTTPTKIDLVESFNFLIGLQVRSIRKIKDFVLVEGQLQTGEKSLVIWRDLEQINNDHLDKFFQNQIFSSSDMEFDLIYVNGDNNLQNNKNLVLISLLYPPLI